MTTTTPTFPIGARVIAAGQPMYVTAPIREGGPGRVIRDDADGTRPFVWVRLDAGLEFPYLTCELKPEPTV